MSSDETDHVDTLVFSTKG